jgi:ComF family protein
MSPLLDVLLPPACASCGSAGALLCASCLQAARPASDASARFVAPDAGVVIGHELALAMAAFAFDGPLRRALARLKYEGAWRLARPLAIAATPVLRDLLEMTGTIPLVPVPVHAERRRVRGYNQAELIALELASSTRVGFADLLERVHPTTKQHRLDRAARLANLRGAFGVAGSVGSVPTAVIVVDDIVTTSGTLEACASVLRTAGAQDVYGFAVAREI